MNPDVIEALAGLAAAVLGMGGLAFFSLMCFPSFRGAIVERMRQRTLRHADATDVAAQLAALRGEVYALRAELAQGARPVGALSDHAEDLSLAAGRQGRSRSSS
jgi:hypothetical protein